eukprot:2265978-Lingulodinium_polyedra.AAC.1
MDAAMANNMIRKDDNVEPVFCNSMRTSRGASMPARSRRSLSGTGEWLWARCSCRNPPSAWLSLRSTA